MDEKYEYPEEMAQKLFIDFDKSELIIIKSHLFIEHALNEYIQANNKSEYEFEKMNFTFSHKINLCKILGLFENDTRLEEYITNMNKLRNQIAHKHTFDKELFNKIINYPASFKDQDKYESEEAFKKDIMILLSAHMCGNISRKTKDVLKTRIRN